MQNPLTQFIQNRFIQPAVNSGVEKALSANHPSAYRTSTVPEVFLAESISHSRDADYTLLYALYY